MTSSWMLAAGAPFAMVGTLAKMLGSQFSSAELAMYRSLIGLVAIGAFLLWRRETVRTPFLRSHPWRGATGTISLVASFYAMTRAYHSGSTVVVGAFAYSTVIFAAIIDALINAFTNESPC